MQAQKNDECTPDQYFLQEDSGDVKNNPKRSCQFNRTVLDQCSGIGDRYYGYQEGQPCIIIKLNRVRKREKAIGKGMVLLGDLESGARESLFLSMSKLNNLLIVGLQDAAWPFTKEVRCLDCQLVVHTNPIECTPGEGDCRSGCSTKDVDGSAVVALL